LQVCVRACQFCADECQHHAREHRHCRICAEICRGAQAGCGHLLGVFSSEAVGESVKPLDRAGLRR